MYVALTRARERLIVSGGAMLDDWPQEGPKASPLTWLAPALLGGDLHALPDAQEPIQDIEVSNGVWVRAAVNRPETVGRVLREESLAPAGASLPIARPPAPRAPAPEPRGAADAVRTLSYSRLSAWKDCGYRFYLQRVLGLPDEPIQEQGDEATVRAIDARTRGSLVHAVLEREGADLAQIAALSGLQLSAEESADVLRLAGAFADSPLARRIARAKSVHREHAFTVALGDTLLTGIVDVLAHERGGAQLVVDYKSDGLDPGTDLAAYVEARYGIQQRVYALAALRGAAARVEVAYAFLERPCEPVSARFEAADADRLEQELLTLAGGLLAGEYPVTPAPHRELCLSCPGRRALCSYGEERTLRPRADL